MPRSETTYKRASEYSKGIGESLDSIQGKDVLVHGYATSTRPMKGDEKTFVEITISTLDDPEVKVLYHAWSDSLSQKFSEIPDGAFPVVAKFVRVQTSSGFRVWTFE